MQTLNQSEGEQGIQSFSMLEITPNQYVSGMEMTLKEQRTKNSCSVTANTNPVLYTQGCVNLFLVLFIRLLIKM